MLRFIYDTIKQAEAAAEVADTGTTWHDVSNNSTSNSNNATAAAAAAAAAAQLNRSASFSSVAGSSSTLNNSSSDAQQQYSGAGSSCSATTQLHDLFGEGQRHITLGRVLLRLQQGSSAPFQVQSLSIRHCAHLSIQTTLVCVI
jgi:hypothetical protein